MSIEPGRGPSKQPYLCFLLKLKMGMPPLLGVFWSHLGKTSKSALPVPMNSSPRTKLGGYRPLYPHRLEKPLRPGVSGRQARRASGERPPSAVHCVYRSLPLCLPASEQRTLAGVVVVGTGWEPLIPTVISFPMSNTEPPPDQGTTAPCTLGATVNA